MKIFLEGTFEGFFRNQYRLRCYRKLFCSFLLWKVLLVMFICCWWVWNIILSEYKIFCMVLCLGLISNGVKRESEFSSFQKWSKFFVIPITSFILYYSWKIMNSTATNFISIFQPLKKPWTCFHRNSLCFFLKTLSYIPHPKFTNLKNISIKKTRFRIHEKIINKNTEKKYFWFINKCIELNYSLEMKLNRIPLNFYFYIDLKYGMEK